METKSRRKEILRLPSIRSVGITSQAEDRVHPTPFPRTNKPTNSEGEKLFQSRTILNPPPFRRTGRTNEKTAQSLYFCPEQTQYGAAPTEKKQLAPQVRHIPSQKKEKMSYRTAAPARPLACNPSRVSSSRTGIFTRLVSLSPPWKSTGPLGGARGVRKDFVLCMASTALSVFTLCRRSFLNRR